MTIAHNVCAVYGIPQLTVYHFARLMREQGLTFLLVDKGVEPRSIKNGVKIAPRPVLMTSVDLYVRNIENFNGLVTVFIIDSPDMLEKVPGIALIGCRRNSLGQWEYEMPTGTDLRMWAESVPVTDRVPVPVDTIQSEILSSIIEKFDTASILSPLQTLFYRVKDLEVRGILQDIVYEYLAKVRGPRQLDSALSALPVTFQLKERILEECAKPEADLLREACEFVISGKGTPETASQRLKVSDFDIRYVVRRYAMKNNKEINLD